MSRSIHAIQIIHGAQWGSEAKGAIAAHLAIEERMDYCVRTGATNAGHTVEYGGTRYAFQQLPVGWVRPEATLIIGAGALIDPIILDREVDVINAAMPGDVRSRLIIDPRAHRHSSTCADRSRQSGRHVLMGATGKGCSEALIDRVRNRGVNDWRVGQSSLVDEYRMDDTDVILNTAFDEGARIQLEGTQGQLLDLCLGPYPYVTHKQTGPAQWLMEAGLSPTLPIDLVAVVRTHPIRVAGNSGPLPGETSWPILAREINEKRRAAGMNALVGEGALIAFEACVRRASAEFSMPSVNAGNNQHAWTGKERLVYREALSNLNAVALAGMDSDVRADLGNLFETTTVTKKLRRIAHIDWPTLEKSGHAIRATRVALTFMDYEFPTHSKRKMEVVPLEQAYIDRVATVMGAPVRWVSRGPRAADIELIGS